MTEGQTEKEWQATVVQTARLLGWACYHTFDSRRSSSGFPDLVLVRDEILAFVELKTDAGKVSAAQKGWLEALRKASAANAGVHVFVWRPALWENEIAVFLNAGHRAGGEGR